MSKFFSQVPKICYTNDTKWAYIPIPKCASLFGMKYFIDGYKMTDQRDWSEDKTFDKNFIIFIRNPLKRWMSGLTEFLFQEKFINNIEYNLEDDKVLRLLFLGCRFDAHTTPQIYFLDHINITNAYFFDIDDPRFLSKLNYFCTLNLGYKVENIPNKNVTSENIFKSKVLEKFLITYNQNSYLRDIVDHRLLPDQKYITYLYSSKKVI